MMLSALEPVAWIRFKTGYVDTVQTYEDMVPLYPMSALSSARRDAFMEAMRECEKKREGATALRVSPSAYDKAAYGWDECAIACAESIRALIDKDE